MKAGKRLVSEVESKTLLEAIVNAPMKYYVSAGTLAAAIKEQNFKAWLPYHIILFSEVPLSNIIEFMALYEITKEEMLDFYNKFIGADDPNKDLEEYLRA